MFLISFIVLRDQDYFFSDFQSYFPNMSRFLTRNCFLGGAVVLKMVVIVVGYGFVRVGMGLDGAVRCSAVLDRGCSGQFIGQILPSQKKIPTARIPIDRNKKRERSENKL